MEATGAGRHRDDSRRAGSARWRRLTRHLDLVAVGVGVAVVAVAALVKIATGVAARCDGDVSLRVSAAPEIAPAVHDVAGRWRSDPPRADGACVHVTVTAVDPAAVAVAVARQSGGALDVGDPVAPTAVPDVWIPDATSWLARVRAVDRNAFTGPAPSAAASPVVLAMPEPLARSYGWPARAISWDQVLDLVRGGDRRAALVEPRRSASGVAALLAFDAAARAAATAAHDDPDTAARDLYAVLAAARTGSLSALLERVRTAPRQSVVVAPLPEWAVFGYDRRQPPVPLAAVYPEPMAPRLDYPIATLARSRAGGTAQPRVLRAATALRAALTSEANRAVFATRGFRAPDGTFGPGFPRGWGITGEPVPASPPVPADQVTQALAAWVRVSLPVRALTVVAVAPTMRQQGRFAVTRDAMTRSVRTLSDACDVGLWVFGARTADGRAAPRELVPVVPLATGRQRLIDALTTVEPESRGGRALRDTVLAAYAATVASYVPGKTHLVVVISDGGDSDPGGMSLPTLLTELEKLSDPTRPVRVVPIGIGPGANVPELNTIAHATGATAVHLPHPATLSTTLTRILTTPQ